MKALDKNGFKVKKYECYHVHNADLGLDDAKMTHECFVIKISKKNNKSKVVIITSLETYKAKTNQYSFKNWKLNDLKLGNIIPVPINQINTTFYSGIFVKGIWVENGKIEKSNKNYKFPYKYKKLLKD